MVALSPHPHIHIHTYVHVQKITLFAGTSLPWACRFDEYGSKATLLGVKTKVDITTRPHDDEERNKVRHAHFGCLVACLFVCLVADNVALNVTAPILPRPFASPSTLWCIRLQTLADALTRLHDDTVFNCRGHFLMTTLWPTNAVIHPGACCVGVLCVVCGCVVWIHVCMQVNMQVCQFTLPDKLFLLVALAFPLSFPPPARSPWWCRCVIRHLARLGRQAVG